MDVLIERCAGLDVHRDTVVATVRRPGPGGTRRSETRTFATTTGRLEQMADWLAAEKVDAGRDGIDRRLLEAGGAPRGAVNRAEVKGLRRWSVAAGW